MDSLNERRLRALSVVSDWAKNESQLFRPGTPAATCLRQIDAAIESASRATLAELRGAADEISGERCGRRRQLRAALVTLCRATRVLDVEAPGLTVVYRRPPHLSDAALSDYAERMLIELEPVRERLLAVLSLSSDYFASVRQGIAALAAAASTQHDARRTHVAARQAIEAALAAGFQALKTLDILVRHHFADDAVKLFSWRHARRIPRSRHRRRRAKPQAA